VADACLPIGPALANIFVRAEARRVACELHPVPIRNFSGGRGEAAIFPCGRGAFLACRRLHSARLFWRKRAWRGASLMRTACCCGAICNNRFYRNSGHFTRRYCSHTGNLSPVKSVVYSPLRGCSRRLIELFTLCVKKAVTTMGSRSDSAGNSCCLRVCIAQMRMGMTT
jgi:hypothetical protein